ncbi:MAG: type II toxin-antitoxin system RelE/ParE family toxin [Candidatus Omnitrophota bacterium]
MKSPDFQVKLDTRATKDLRKLTQKNPVIIPSLIKAIDSLPSNPYKGKALKGDKKGCYSYRSGEYRIIYEIYQYWQSQRNLLVIKVKSKVMIVQHVVLGISALSSFRS